MVDFSNLKRLDVTGETLAEYVWDGIEGEPSLWLAPATDANSDFQNERLRLLAERVEADAKAPRQARPPKVSPVATPEQIEADREVDRKLLSKCCAKRWGTAPLDANGKPAPFTEEACYDFFRALPNYLFDPLRGFAANVYNFVPKVGVTEGQADALGNG